MKLGDLVRSEEAFGNLMAAKPVAAHISFRLARLAAQIAPIMKAHMDAKLVILEKLGTRDEKRPGYYMVKPENVKDFAEAMNPLLQEDITLTIPLVTLEDLKAVTTLTGEDMAGLDWLIQEVTPVAPGKAGNA